MEGWLKQANVGEKLWQRSVTATMILILSWSNNLNASNVDPRNQLTDSTTANGIALFPLQK